MYNRYLTTNCAPTAYEPTYTPPCAQQPSPCGVSQPPHCNGKPNEPTGNPLNNLFSSIGSIKFDANLIFAIAVIWFLLSDGDASNTDLIIIIGILLLLGL